MKILIIRTFPSILDSHIYNIQEIGLAKALIRKGHICDIVLYNGAGKSKEEKIAVQGSKREITIFWTKGYNLLKNGIMPKVKKIADNYDVVQVHEYDQIMSWYLYSYSKVPTVIYHGPYYDEYNRGYNLKCKIFDRTFLKWKQKEQQVCLTKSDLASQFLTSKGFCNVVTAGVGLDEETLSLQDQECREFQIDASKVSLLYVGKIEERRNILFLLDVFRKIIEKHNNYELIIVGNGNGSYYEQFKNAASDLIEEGSLLLYQEAKQWELKEIYRKCDLFLFPSHYDIFGMVLLEAAYYGLPIISSINGGAVTIIKDKCDGEIVDNFEVQEWVTTVLNYTKKSEDDGNFLNDGSYSWNYLADIFIDGYNRAINMQRKN